VTQNGCSSAPSNSILVLPVSVKEFPNVETFDIYPNPTTGIMNLKVVSNNDEYFIIEIFNNYGARVWKQENVIIDGQYFTKIDLNGFPNGVYSVSLRNRFNTIVKKVILMK